MTLSDSSYDDRRKLRASLRARRWAVPPRDRAHLSQLVARNVDRAFHLRPDWRIAVYAALPEELDTAPLIDLARERGCHIYLPRIDARRSSGKMRFILSGEERHRPNRFGISEPQGSKLLNARWLDVVFLPLVGFDARGTRLGTGGGYYDRALGYIRARRAWRVPRLVGLAYAFQQVERIAAAAHDVPLDAVVTEKGVIRCTTG
ncbi:MAG TPA: 5-formyltetrahydrofolate cyclo-ligase [Steroidobacteraceae bacterium]|nr:5-formyltetrahydrofolate cyclo-ligase [Steroidobacteraceae bacterium]